MEILLSLLIFSMTGLVAIGTVWAGIGAYERASIESSARALLLDYENALRSELEGAEDPYRDSESGRWIYTSSLKGCKGFLQEENGIIRFVSLAGQKTDLCTVRDHMTGTVRDGHLYPRIDYSFDEDGVVSVSLRIGTGEDEISLESTFSVVPLQVAL